MTTNKEILRNNVDTVFYHQGCNDGKSAAFAVWFANKNKSIKYIGMHPGKFPAIDVTGKHVAMVDVSCDCKTIKSIINKAKSFVILDHHVSAEKELTDIPDTHKVFDMKHSGAVLA